jgi:hypothetical protein
MANTEKVTEEVTEVTVECAHAAGITLLDLLPTYEDKMNAILNWAKYAMLRRTEERCPGEPSMGRYMKTYSDLCARLATNVMELPELYLIGIAAEMEAEGLLTPCGECETCMSNQKEVN